MRSVKEMFAAPKSYYVNASKKRLKSLTTKLLGEKCMSLLNSSRVTDQHLRIVNEAFGLPQLPQRIFCDFPLLQFGNNDTALLKGLGTHKANAHFCRNTSHIKLS